MRTRTVSTFLIVLSCVFSADRGFTASGRTITINQNQSAQDIYDSGFARGVMRDGDGAVRLWDRLLIENDSPGAGTSNKGNFMEPVYGARQVKKILTVDNPECTEAYVIVYAFIGVKLTKREYPLSVTLNGHTTTYKHLNTEQYVYVPVDPSWLRKGGNEIIIACPDAPESESGWAIYLARADEYKAGGGDPDAVDIERRTQSEGVNLLTRGLEEVKAVERYPRGVGNHSLLSENGGRSFTTKGKCLHPQPTHMFGKETKFDEGGVIGEYLVRINLRCYTREGTLSSPVIDLWSEPGSGDAMIPFSEVEKLRFSFRGATPSQTNIVWQIRTGVTMDPYKSGDWTDWISVASGARAEIEPEGRFGLPPTHWDPERFITLPKVRYIQWRAVLQSSDPLATPSVQSVGIDRNVTRRMELPENIIVRDVHNPDILYSSTGFTYQSADEPRNKEVIDREDLDAVVKGVQSEFVAIVRLLNYASRRWVYAGPRLEYPKWNAVDIAERAHSFGDGGMCIQHAAFLAHILTVMGYQARHVNIIAHEVVEVWCNDFDKWVYLDPTQGVDCYLYDTRTGIPLSLDDMHKAYYTLYGVQKPIDWMLPTVDWYTLERDYSRLPISMSTTDPRIMLRHEKNGMLLYYDLCAFLRMMPRNNFSTTSIPEPLQQGNYCPWPWDGYINWYDELAPPKLQYSNHTDRVCDFWPTLNRVKFEAVPEVNGDAVFIRMITFTPSFRTFQVKLDGKDWVDSDEHVTWRLHEGINRLEMRAVTGFGVTGHPSYIECNVVSKPIPKPVGIGTMNQ